MSADRPICDCAACRAAVVRFQKPGRNRARHDSVELERLWALMNDQGGNR